MTLLTTLTRRPARFVRALLGATPEDSDQLGPEAIGAARHELRTDGLVTQATVGTPRLEQYGGAFTTDLKAVVPVTTTRYEDPAPLTFDVDGDTLARFCEAFGADVDNIGALEGESVPLKWVNGTPVPAWDQLSDHEEGA